jgi:hypothetical protein
MSKNTTQIKAAVVREKGGPFSIASRTLIEALDPNGIAMTAVQQGGIR